MNEHSEPRLPLTPAERAALRRVAVEAERQYRDATTFPNGFSILVPVPNVLALLDEVERLEKLVDVLSWAN